MLHGGADLHVWMHFVEAIHELGVLGKDSIFARVNVNGDGLIGQIGSIGHHLDVEGPGVLLAVLHERLGHRFPDLLLVGDPVVKIGIGHLHVVDLEVVALLRRTDGGLVLEDGHRHEFDHSFAVVDVVVGGDLQA